MINISEEDEKQIETIVGKESSYVVFDSDGNTYIMHNMPMHAFPSQSASSIGNISDYLLSQIGDKTKMINVLIDENNSMIITQIGKLYFGILIKKDHTGDDETINKIENILARYK